MVFLRLACGSCFCSVTSSSSLGMVLIRALGWNVAQLDEQEFRILLWHEQHSIAKRCYHHRTDLGPWHVIVEYLLIYTR